MDERFVGIVIKDGRIVDLMVYYRQDEASCNLRASFRRENADYAELSRAWGNGDGRVLVEAYHADTEARCS